MTLDGFLTDINMVEAKEEVETEVLKDNWMCPIIEYLKDSKLPEDKNKARKLRLKAMWCMIIDEVLFKK